MECDRPLLPCWASSLNESAPPHDVGNRSVSSVITQIRPNGSIQENAAVTTWPRSQSERARSSLRFSSPDTAMGPKSNSLQQNDSCYSSVLQDAALTNYTPLPRMQHSPALCKENPNR